MNQNKFGLWVSLIAIVIAIGALVCAVNAGNSTSDSLGAATPGTRFPHGITIGLPTNSPSNIGDLKSGSCSMTADTSITATSTGYATCAITGVVAGDNVFVSTATTTPADIGSLLSQFVVLGARASTTPGIVDIRLLNLTGKNAAPSAYGFGSSTSYVVTKTQ